jgi:hypothetical protein
MYSLAYVGTKATLTISVREMLLKSVRLCCCLIAERQQQVLRNVSAVVFKRCNNTAVVTQTRPEEWDNAKPFEDIPGPKPLPILGNTWRFIPHIGIEFYCFFTPFNVLQLSESMQQTCALSICQYLVLS